MNHPELLTVAKRLVWFKAPDDALKDVKLFPAQVMTYGTLSDMTTTLRYFSEDDFEAVLNDPQHIQDRQVDRLRPPHRGAKTTVSELAAAPADLKTSLDLSLQQKDLANASLSVVKIGTIQRLQNQWQPAAQLYQAAIELAKRANRTDYQPRRREDGTVGKIKDVPLLEDLSEQDYKRIGGARNGTFGFSARSIRRSGVPLPHNTFQRSSRSFRARSLSFLRSATSLASAARDSHKSKGRRGPGR